MSLLITIASSELAGAGDSIYSPNMLLTTNLQYIKICHITNIKEFCKKNVLDYNINVFTQGLVHSMCAINFSSCFIARGIA